MKLVGVGGTFSISPMMSEEFQVRFQTEREALDADSRLQALHVEGVPLLRIDRRGSEIYTGCSIYGQIAPEAVISRGSEKQVTFFKVLYQSEGLKSGMHHTDGLLWIRRPDRAHAVQPKKVSIRSIAPTVLSLLHIKRPDSMKCASVVCE